MSWQVPRFVVASSGAAGIAYRESGAVPKQGLLSPANVPSWVLALPPWHLPEHPASSGSGWLRCLRGAGPPPQRPSHPGCTAWILQWGLHSIGRIRCSLGEQRC